MNETLSLSAGAARVDLFPGAGGRIGQITVAGRELLRGPEHAGAGWGAWGSYPLVPWSNRIPGGVATFGGLAIEVPVNWPDGTAIHGLAADTAWRVELRDTSSATLAIDLDVDRYRVAATQRFDVEPGGLEQVIELTNRAEWSVPVGIGIHPWFAVAPVTVPADLVWPGDGPMPTGLPRPVGVDEDLRHARLAPPMDRCFTGLTGDTATIGDLTLSWSGPITQVVVYSGEADWVCVEPVTMANDGIRLADEGVDGTGVIALAPGSSVEVTYRFAWPL